MSVGGQPVVDTAGAADRITGATLAGHNIKLASNGAITVTGPTNAIPVAGAITLQSDVSMSASGAISTGAVTAGRDINLVGIGPGSVTTGALQSSRDIAISSSGGIAAAAADAGDDIVLRAGGTIAVAGGLTTHGADVDHHDRSRSGGRSAGSLQPDQRRSASTSL